MKKRSCYWGFILYFAIVTPLYCIGLIELALGESIGGFIYVYDEDMHGWTFIKGMSEGLLLEFSMVIVSLPFALIYNPLLLRSRLVYNSYMYGSVLYVMGMFSWGMFVYVIEKIRKTRYKYDSALETKTVDNVNEPVSGCEGGEKGGGVFRIFRYASAIFVFSALMWICLSGWRPGGGLLVSRPGGLSGWFPRGAEWRYMYWLDNTVVVFRYDENPRITPKVYVELPDEPLSSYHAVQVPGEMFFASIEKKVLMKSDNAPIDETLPQKHVNLFIEITEGQGVWYPNVFEGVQNPRLIYLGNIESASLESSHDRIHDRSELHNAIEGGAYQ